MELFVILGVAVIFVLWLIMGYNKFIAQIEAVTNSEKEISVQLDRRGKVFDSLISTVKKYMEHEEGVLTQITALRSKTQSVDPKVAEEAQNELSNLVSSGELSKGLNITMEAYPDLKASNNMLQLQEEIVSTENKLNFAKKAFNNNIENYNKMRKSFPSLIIPKIITSVDKEFEYWSLSEEQVKTQEEKRVEF
jgi:LemA protein